VWWTLAWAADGPTLPVVKEQPPAAYPERALERAIEGDVLLRLTIDDQGLVAGVELLEGAGHGFDGPAVEAAYAMRFEPARDERGRAVPAVIEFRTQFRMAKVPPLSIEGKVRSRNDKRAYESVRVRAIGPDGEEAMRTVTDERGMFRFAALPPGTWLLTVDSPALLPTTQSVELPPDTFLDGVALQVEERPDFEEGDPLIDEFVEVVGSVEVEPAERVIDHDLVVKLPGSFGDPVRALQNLPGVARAPFGSGQLLVRGNEAADTAYHLDGMRIPLAFHFSAVSTVVAADLLDRVEMIPGGYGARYGNAIGGVVDLATTTDLPRKGHTSASADVFQATVFTHQRMGKNTSIVMSARRSYADVVLQPVLASLDAGALRVPRYYDAQLHLVQRVAKDDRVTATFFLSEDRFRLIGASGVDSVTYRTGFQKVQLRYVTDRGRWRNEAAVSLGPEVQEIVLSGEEADLGAFGVPVNLFGEKAGTLREEAPMRLGWREEALLVPADTWFGLRVGTDGTLGKQNLLYTLGDEPESEDTVITAPAFYVEPTFRLGPVDLIPGGRLTVLQLQYERARATVDPRLRTVVDAGQVELLGAVGLYSQTPAFRELVDPVGDTLGFERSFTASAGARYLLGDRGELGATVYRQQVWDLVVGRDDLFRFDQTSLDPGRDFEDFENDGVGNGTGLELFGRWADDKLLLWGSVSLARAFRQLRPETEWRPAESDQPVNIVLIGSRSVSRKSRVGTRARFASGPPMTPIVGGAYATDLQEWLPISGEPWSDRARSFFSLDVRFDHDVRWRKAELELYAELQNVTNQRNVEIPAWSEDWSRFQPTYGLPVFPSFGLKVDL
jgi:TonB family protein